MTEFGCHLLIQTICIQIILNIERVNKEKGDLNHADLFIQLVGNILKEYTQAQNLRLPPQTRLREVLRR